MIDVIEKSNRLSADESARLAECEGAIQSGMATFVQVGTALIEISDKRLYRETHGSFEDYCHEKWKMSARRAYQLCEGAEIINSIASATPAVSKSVNHGSQSLNERQVRALAKVPKAKRVAVLNRAVKATGGKVTAKAIEAAAEPKKAEPKKAEPKIDEEKVAHEMQVVIADADFLLGKFKTSDKPTRDELLESAKEFERCARLMRGYAEGL